MPPTDHRLRPRRTPRQDRSRATRERILAAAARVFADRGYAGGTTNHIAAEAGLSVGSLYQYFPNKDAVAAELMRAHVADGAAHVARRLAEVTGAGTEPDLTGRLRPLVDAAVDNHRGDLRLHRVLFEEAPRPADVLRELHDLEDAAVSAGADILRADPTVRVDDPRLAAWFVAATIESLTHRFVAGHPDAGDGEMAAFATELTRLLVAYLRSPPVR